MAYHKTKRELSQRQLMAIQYMMEGSSKADAMRMAGYSHGYVRCHIHTMFKNPKVKAEVKRRQARVRKKYELDEDWVIQRLMLIADSGAILAKFKKVTEDGLLSWDFTGATEAELAAINELTVTSRSDRDGRVTTKFKIGTSDPKGALDSLARKLGLFKDSMEVTGELSLVERITRGRERVRKEKEDAEGTG